MPFAIFNGMKSIVLTLDQAGRVVLPKRLRERFRLRAGSRLEVVVGDEELTLRPIGQSPTLSQEHGWWVHTGAPDPGSELEDAVRRHRDERIEDLSR